MLRHRVRDCGIEAAIQDVEFFSRDRRILLDGQLGNHLTHVPVVVNHLRDAEAHTKEIAAVVAGAAVALLLVACARVAEDRAQSSPAPSAGSTGYSGRGDFAMTSDGRLHRTFRGEAKGIGYLEDYAYLGDALLARADEIFLASLGIWH